MKIFLSIFAALLLCQCASAQIYTNLSFIETFTKDEENAGMVQGVGSVEMYIQNLDDAYCITPRLNNAGPTFEDGGQDIFSGPSELGQCYNFYLPGATSPRMRLQHHGTDAWKYEHIYLHLLDGTVLNCGPDASGTIDRQEYIEFPCIDTGMREEMIN